MGAERDRLNQLKPLVTQPLRIKIVDRRVISAEKT